tara:strand:- start:322 stop:477 length:156 start_codon:yes stop_codon:yes gene_type:complete
MASDYKAWRYRIDGNIYEMSIYSNSFEGRKPGNPNILFRKKGDIFFKINPK